MGSTFLDSINPHYSDRRQEEIERSVNPPRSDPIDPSAEPRKDPFGLNYSGGERYRFKNGKKEIWTGTEWLSENPGVKKSNPISSNDVRRITTHELVGNSSPSWWRSTRRFLSQKYLGVPVWGWSLGLGVLGFAVMSR